MVAQQNSGSVKMEVTTPKLEPSRKSFIAVSSHKTANSSTIPISYKCATCGEGPSFGAKFLKLESTRLKSFVFFFPYLFFILLKIFTRRFYQLIIDIFLKKDSMRKTKDNKDLVDQLDYANNRILVLEEELSNKLYQNEQLNCRVCIYFILLFILLFFRKKKSVFYNNFLPYCIFLRVYFLLNSYHTRHLLHQFMKHICKRPSQLVIFYRMYPYDATMEQLPVHVKNLSSEFNRCSMLFDNPLFIIDECLQKGIIQLIILLSVSWCDIHLEEKNHEWSAALKRLFSAIDSICCSMEIKPLCTITVCKNLDNLALAFRELDSSFHIRWIIESRFPTATKRFSCIGNALTDCLARLVVDSAKLTARVNAIKGPEQKNGLNSKNADKSHGYHLFDDNNESEDSREPNNHKSYLPDGIIHFVDKETSTVEMDGEENQNKLNSEDKLGQISLEKTSAIVKDEQINYLKSRVVFLESEREKHLVDLSLLRRKLANLGGKELDGIDDVEFVKKFNDERLRSMMDAVEVAECASRYYKKECEILLRKYYVSIEEKRTLKEADELSSVRRSYDSQLARLTEHVADLNGKLIEIEKEKERTPVQTPRGLKSLFLK
uniref:TACC_C domain-containing protein n=1 Tax=Heterorhabditis bacteriophora TaxID=37862 RepID=A0A1I7X0P0_HETBA